jgi:hypothetical protein
MERLDARGALDLRVFLHIVTELSENDRGGERAWHATALQSAYRNVERSCQRSTFFCALEKPCLSLAPVIAILAQARQSVLGQVDKRRFAPAADCRAPATDAVPTTPDAVTALR